MPSRLLVRTPSPLMNVHPAVSLLVDSLVAFMHDENAAARPHHALAKRNSTQYCTSTLPSRIVLNSRCTAAGSMQDPPLRPDILQRLRTVSRPAVTRLDTICRSQHASWKHNLISLFSHAACRKKQRRQYFSQLANISLIEYRRLDQRPAFPERYVPWFMSPLKGRPWLMAKG